MFNQASHRALVLVAILPTAATLSTPRLVSTDAPVPAGSAPRPTPAHDPLLEPDAEHQKAELAFVHKIEDSMNRGGGTYFDQSVDVVALMRQAAKGLALAPADLTLLTNGVKSQFHTGVDSAAAIKAANGSYTFLAVHVVNGQRRALFRLLLNNDGLNYHDLILSLDDQHQYHVADIYNFSSGERLSATFRRFLAPRLAEGDPERIKLLSPAELAMLKNQTQFHTLLDLNDQQKFADALKIYNAFPVTLQEDKNVLLIAIQISGHDPDGQTASLIKTYARLYPEDPALDILQLNQFRNEKKQVELLACLTRLDQRVGPDAVLLSHRADCLVDQDKLVEAAAIVEKAIALESSLERPYWVKVRIGLLQQNWEGVRQTLAQFEKAVGHPYGDISKNKLFEPFLASDPGKKWQAAH